jgi:hypothetical protein
MERNKRNKGLSAPVDTPQCCSLDLPGFPGLDPRRYHSPRSSVTIPEGYALSLRGMNCLHPVSSQCPIMKIGASEILNAIAHRTTEMIFAVLLVITNPL